MSDDTSDITLDVNGFAKIAAPLNSLLRKGESPQFGALNEDQLLALIPSINAH
jgi:hypothetical protein